MSDHRKTHNGRDIDGGFRVRQVDVEEVLENPDGVDIVRDDVRLGGAVADTGINAAQPAREIGELIADNREDVDRVTGRSSRGRGRRSRRTRALNAGGVVLTPSSSPPLFWMRETMHSQPIGRHLDGIGPAATPRGSAALASIGAHAVLIALSVAAR